MVVINIRFPRVKVINIRILGPGVVNIRFPEGTFINIRFLGMDVVKISDWF